MALSDKERAAEWVNAWKRVSQRDLAWHMTACLEHDGEKVLGECFRLLEIKTPMDFVRRAK